MATRTLSATDTTPVQVGRHWVWPDGTRLPVISGGADGDDNKPPPKGDDKDKGDDKPLGDGGERALKAERDARRKAEADLRSARDELAKMKTDQDASKSDIEKLLAKVDGLETRAVEAERKALIADIAQDMGLTAAQARRLQGSTRAELVADAEELLDAFGGKKPTDKGKDDSGEADKSDADNGGDGKADDKGKNGDVGSKPPPAGKPKEKLQGGATPPDSGDAVDPVKLAKSILDSPF